MKSNDFNFEFDNAYKLISKYLPKTPLVKNDWLSKKYNCSVYLKLENLQPVGSFKLRGATYKIDSLTNKEKENGVVAVSAGNHAQGVAWAASLFKTKATIIMPENSPIVKIANSEALGAEVILKGQNVDESFEFVKEYLKENNKVYIHPFFDEKVITGQGTLALELLDQLDNIDYIFSAIGGGGLCSGIAAVMQQRAADCKVVGSQSSGANSMVLSLKSGRLQSGETVHTFADGIKVRNPQKEMYELLDELLHDSIEVSDDEIAKSVLELMERARVIAEGAGAISLAAFDRFYRKNSDAIKGCNIVLIISGGNIDINLIDRIIDKGLIQSSRKLRIRVLLNDRPGSLKLLTEIISKNGANILQVTHDRESAHLDILSSIVDVQVETKGKEHSEQLKREIKEHFNLLYI